jgi:import inner membrane translocase subunit TIM22
MAQEQPASAIDDPNSLVVSDAVPEAPAANAVEDAKAERKRLPPGQRTYRRVELPTPEQMAQDEFMNNCGTRTVLSAVMGSGLGVLFGIFMGTMETSVRSSTFLMISF